MCRIPVATVALLVAGSWWAPLCIRAQEALTVDTLAVDSALPVPLTVPIQALPPADTLVSDSLLQAPVPVLNQESLPVDTLVLDSALQAPVPVSDQGPLPADTLVSESALQSLRPVSDSVASGGRGTVVGGDRLGASLVTLQDQNSDGIADVAVGAAGSDRSALNAGAVLILAGHSGDTLRVHEGERAGDAFGASLAALGDIDADGVGDLAVGASHWDLDSTTIRDAGKVYVFSGASGNPLYSVSGTRANGRLGRSLAGLGDTNGDGVNDLATGLTQSGPDSLSGAGPASVLLLSGADGAVLHEVKSPALHDQFGSALSSAGDLDQDGFCDLLIGAYRDSQGALLSTGAVYTVSGRTGQILGVTRGGNMFEHLGFAVAGGRDINADRVPDWAAGARFVDMEGGRRGQVHAFSGKDGALIVTLTGFVAGQQFGTSLCFTEDQDGDASADLLVGAPGFNRREESSEGVYQLSSRSGSALLSVKSDSAGNRFGCAVADASDLDGDGRADLFVGAAHSAVGGLFAGQCYAVSGRSGSVLWTRTGRSALKRSETVMPDVPLMNLEQLREEVAGYDFPVYDTSEVDAAPIIRRSVAAVYPPSAMASGLSGWVKVKILVLPDGTAAESEVVDDAGLGPDFRDAAISAVRDWQFLAASLGGEEVACWVVFPLGFAPPLPPEEQRRLDSLAALGDSSQLAVDSLSAVPPVVPGDSAVPGVAFYELDQVDVKPVLAGRVEPNYPSAAMIMRETCTVKLRVLVNREGAVADVQMVDVSVRGKGFESSAMAAVRKWRYEPALKADAKVAVWVPEEIVFTPPDAGQN